MKFLCPLLVVCAVPLHSSGATPNGLAVAAPSSGSQSSVAVSPDVLDLAGVWGFSTDAGGVGEKEKWYLKDLDGSVRLPGSMAENKKGDFTKPRPRTNELSTEYEYRGAAWYRKTIVIPEDWAGRAGELFIGRSKVSKAWLDGVFLGENKALGVPQRYAIPELEPGAHTLTVMVDNRVSPAGNIGGHMLTSSVQSDWNGLLGDIRLEAFAALRLADISVRSDVATRVAHVTVAIANAGKSGRDITLSLRADPFNSPRAEGMPERIVTRRLDVPPGGMNATVDLPLGPDALLWDEFDPALYRLAVSMREAGSEKIATKDAEFGLREFTRKGTQFVVNGRTVMLRGKHDAMAFPLTGYAPMDYASWLRVLTIAKSYGINHYRFHTCTPPDAAFLAADRVGIYMQPELYNNQGAYGGGAAGDYNLEEGGRILKEYGDHPSFVMLALGNEMGEGRALRAAHIAAFRDYDPTRLYAQGTNNEWWKPMLAPGDDYWTTVRTVAKSADHAVRGSFAHVDNPLGHIQTDRPSTEYDYSVAIAGVPVPVIGQEMGQYQFFPDYHEIPKYTGVQKPWNLLTFRRRLEKAGMADEAEAFAAASGALAILGYREEIEASLRTPGFGGFQLLDLQDYPGQGTALVGILDAFMDSKGLISPAAWRNFCGPVVPLARFKSYTWTGSQKFEARIQLAQYGPKDLSVSSLRWSLRDARGAVLKSGSLPAIAYPQGRLVTAGKLELSLADLPVPARYDLDIALDGTDAKNSYPLWVYADKPDTRVPSGVKLVRRWDAGTKALLEAGETVVLMPATAETSGIKGFFTTDFWNFHMFGNMSKDEKWKQPGTMGLLIEMKHPALKDFPTSTHSDRQWFDLVTDSRALILDGTPRSFRPIVQVIDNIERNHKLGVLLEARVGKGKLLVCTLGLPEKQESPAARAMLASILAYAGAGMSPRDALTYGDVDLIFNPKPESKPADDGDYFRRFFNERGGK